MTPLSSPMDSPDAPITSSVATLQSGDSYTFRRQVRPTDSTNIKMPLSPKPAQSSSSLSSQHYHHYHHKNKLSQHNNKTDNILASSLILFSRTTSPVDETSCSKITDNLLLDQNTYETQNSITKTPDTPSAIITPTDESSGQSQRQSSECSLVLPKINNYSDSPTSPSAILTPSSDLSSEHHINIEDYQEFPNLIGFEDDPWDIVGFESRFDRYTFDSHLGSTVSFLPDKPTPPDSLEL